MSLVEEERCSQFNTTTVWWDAVCFAYVGCCFTTPPTANDVIARTTLQFGEFEAEAVTLLPYCDQHPNTPLGCHCWLGGMLNHQRVRAFTADTAQKLRRSMIAWDEFISYRDDREKGLVYISWTEQPINLKLHLFGRGGVFSTTGLSSCLEEGCLHVW